ncbi:MAG: saccharopine dehydrogenase C-terminal domain-containing protein [Bacteroidales bacterium]
MAEIVILGAGMIGRAMALDLSKKHNIIATDISEAALDSLKGSPNIKTLNLDVNDNKSLAAAINTADIVISAVPGFLGLQTMTRVIELGKDLVDISFLPEDVRFLDPLAREKGVTVVMDCGVAPGMPNFIAGYYNEIMVIDEFEYMVGGLPIVRTFPFEYKAPFSPCDVIEEYTRPARFVENGKIVVKPAMSDPELVNFDKAGTLEAFNTDGLRSLIYTLGHVPFMKEKTLRYPGHIRMIQALKVAGFFETETMEFDGNQVSPFDFTSRILFDAWKLGPEEKEFTVMRIKIKGKENGNSREVIYDLYDEYDTVEKISSMARTTGFTATGTAEMILDGLFTEKGVYPPELVGKNRACFDYIISYLRERKIEYEITS